MRKDYIENTKNKLQKELVDIKTRLLELVSMLKTTNTSYGIEDIETLKKDIENEDWYMISTSVRFLNSVLVILEKDETIKESNKKIVKQLNEVCSRLNNVYSTLHRCDMLVDKGPLIVNYNTIIITDPCYLIKDRDETHKPKWNDFFSYGNMREYPDYDKEKDCSLQFNQENEKYDIAYKKWEEENPDDWDRCNYGDNLEVLGINNFLCANTIYGDWSCTTFDLETKKAIGHFCADAGLVCVCLLDEVLQYNPDFLNWAKEHDWCVTIIDNFMGEIWIKVDETTDDDYEVYVEGIGNKSFKTSQTGL